VSHKTDKTPLQVIIESISACLSCVVWTLVLIVVVVAIVAAVAWLAELWEGLLAADGMGCRIGQEGHCSFGGGDVRVEGQAEGEGEGGEGGAVAGEESGAEGVVLDAGGAGGGVGCLFGGQEGVADVGWVVDLESHGFSYLGAETQRRQVGQISEVSADFRNLLMTWPHRTARRGFSTTGG